MKINFRFWFPIIFPTFTTKEAARPPHWLTGSPYRHLALPHNDSHGPTKQPIPESMLVIQSPIFIANGKITRSTAAFSGIGTRVELFQIIITPSSITFTSNHTSSLANLYALHNPSPFITHAVDGLNPAPAAMYKLEYQIQYRPQMVEDDDHHPYQKLNPTCSSFDEMQRAW